MNNPEVDKRMRLLEAQYMNDIHNMIIKLRKLQEQYDETTEHYNKIVLHLNYGSLQQQNNCNIDCL